VGRLFGCSSRDVRGSEEEGRVKSLASSAEGFALTGCDDARGWSFHAQLHENRDFFRFHHTYYIRPGESTDI
jgi:hypothetical protein